MNLEIQELVMKSDDLLEAVLVYLEKTNQEHKGLVESLNEVMSLIKELE